MFTASGCSGISTNFNTATGAQETSLYSTDREQQIGAGVAAAFSADERKRATAIVEGLSVANQRFAEGERDARALLDCVKVKIEGGVLDLQYAEVTDPESLESWSKSLALPNRALLAVAAYCGRTRLIDNIVLGEDPNPVLTRRQPGTL